MLFDIVIKNYIFYKKVHNLWKISLLMSPSRLRIIICGLLDCGSNFVFPETVSDHFEVNMSCGASL